MGASCRERFPWPLWPLAAAIDVTGCALRLAGRALLVVLGLSAMVVGGIVTATIVGAPIGVPLFAVGLLLAVRGIF